MRNVCSAKPGSQKKTVQEYMQLQIFVSVDKILTPFTNIQALREQPYRHVPCGQNIIFIIWGLKGTILQAGMSLVRVPMK
jgi:hypothetical protein